MRVATIAPSLPTALTFLRQRMASSSSAGPAPAAARGDVVGEVRAALLNMGALHPTQFAKQASQFDLHAWRNVERLMARCSIIGLQEFNTARAAALQETVHQAYP